MLKATGQERQAVLDYMSAEAPEETVELVQKVYTERVLSTAYDIWDVHTNQGRWWIITNPTMLYSQTQFPNMDLALTFHVGLGLRIPRSDRPTLEDLQVEPFMACWRSLDEATAAMDRAEEVEDFQAIGVRCRESLLSLIHVGQEQVQVAELPEKPMKSDFRAWSELIANTVLPGQSHKERRGLLKSASQSAWSFTNWLTHARDAGFNDAQAAVASTEQALSLLTTALIRHLRGVPDRCPSCGSLRLIPERAFDPDSPEDLYERPACQKCSWKGAPVRIPSAPLGGNPTPPEGDCITMDLPLRDSGRGKGPRQDGGR